MNSVGPVETRNSYANSIFPCETLHKLVIDCIKRFFSGASSNCLDKYCLNVLHTLSSTILLGCQNETSILSLCMNMSCLILQGLQVKFSQQL